MIIDCHGHYTTAPKDHEGWRQKQIAALTDHSNVPPRPKFSDDEIRETIVNAQLKLQRERGTDLTIFSPRAAGMAHHLGNAETSAEWARDLQRSHPPRLHALPREFRRRRACCRSPPACRRRIASPSSSAAVKELGFVGCNLNPDPSGGYWKDPPLTDRYWYPIYEKMVELDVPAMVHVSASCNPCFHGTGAHYINGDTTAFMQFLTSDLFKDFPTLKFIIPHGGGAVPYHWGRYRGLAQDMKKPPLKELLLKNVYFDTCVYHLPGIELLTRVIPIDNILFASEMVGAVRGIDPETGHNYDDTKRYVDALSISADDKRKIFEGNMRKVFPLVGARLAKMGAARA